MKRVLYLVFISVFALTGCFEDPGTAIVFEDSDEFKFVEFKGASAASADSRLYVVQQDGATILDSVKIAYGGVTPSADVTVTYEIVTDESTAIEGVDFVLESPLTLTIPAGSFETGIAINVVDDILNPENPAKTITFRITDASVNVPEEYATHTVTFNGVCPYDYENDVAGTYTAVSSGTSTDGNVAEPEVTDLTLAGVEFTVNADASTDAVIAYDVSAVFGGIYEEWYCAPYNLCFNTAGTILVDRTTGAISGTVASAFLDCCGDEFPVAGAVDACAGGVITISWTNAFGDVAETVFTKE